MLLERLNEYGYRIEREAAEQKASVPSDYTEQTIPWIIDLDSKGSFQGLIRTSSGNSKKDRGKRFPVPYLRRSGINVKPQLLADKAEFVLGVPDKDVARAKARHQDFTVLVKACGDTTSENSVKAVVRFLEGTGYSRLPDSEQVSPGDFVTFRVDGAFPINAPTVQEFWRKVAPHLGEKGIDQLTLELIDSWIHPSPTATEQRDGWKCIICGHSCSPARVHPVAIKLPRLVADQQCSIVTANKDAFFSYGLEQSLIAPTCRPCAERYAKAANHLIAKESTHITVGATVYVFWTREEQGFSFASLLSRPEPEEVKALIDSARVGTRPPTELDPTPFYATAFSASGGRVVVREWLETTVEAARESLARWFQLQSIVGEWGETDLMPLPIKGYLRTQTQQWVEGLVECVVTKIKGRRDIQQVDPNVPKVLLHVALKGGPLPRWLLFQAVKRNRAEQGITRGRAALIKMVRLSQQSDSLQEVTMVEMDPENRSPAYLCGRLLAVLEAIQQAAIPGAGTTITDRFFGTASSAPASVFGRLMRGAQAHLGKLRREKRGTYEALQKRLEEIQEHLEGYPKTLTLEDQGLFSLGYYHQRAASRAAAIAHKRP